ncbi:MAG: hypothetical protein H0W43_09910 [Chthoniobacterales bacterium]|nr:hypothetical protein [Chthoniobacterales bacterium]
MSHSSFALPAETDPAALPAPRPSSPRSHRSGWIIAGILGALLLCSPLAFTKWPHYSATAVCKSCGLRKDFFDWDLRFSKSTIHRFTTESPTAISQALAGHQPAQRHEHDWTAFAAIPLTGNEADGTPPNLLYTVEAPRVARFAENLATYTNSDTQTKWRRAILDPAYAAVFAPSLRFMRFPESGFADAAAFDRWWRQAQFPLWNRLRELTEPD